MGDDYFGWNHEKTRPKRPLEDSPNEGGVRPSEPVRLPEKRKGLKSVWDRITRRG